MFLNFTGTMPLVFNLGPSPFHFMGQYYQLDAHQRTALDLSFFSSHSFSFAFHQRQSILRKTNVFLFFFPFCSN